MTPVTELTLWLIASLIIIVGVIYKTYTSSFSKDRKIVLYIVTILMPIVGVIIYFIFRKQQLSFKSSDT